MARNIELGAHQDVMAVQNVVMTLLWQALQLDFLPQSEQVQPDDDKQKQLSESELTQDYYFKQDCALVSEPVKEKISEVIDDLELKAGGYFTDANLPGVTIEAADLKGIVLSRANLKGAHFSPEVILRLSRFNDADLSGATLNNVNLFSANLFGINLEKAQLKNTILRQVDMSGANLKKADFTGADLRKADLSNADLSDADFSGANLADANLEGAVLTGLIIDDDTVLDGTILEF